MTRNKRYICNFWIFILYLKRKERHRVDMKIYLIRHGETDWNVERKLQGRSDIPLNGEGKRLAKVTAEALADVAFSRIFTSPLMRAKETAMIIKGDREIPIIEEERIQEISFGIYEGFYCAENHYTIPDPDFIHFFKKPEAYHAPKGAETIEALCERTTDFLNELVHTSEYQEETILISTHGAALRGLLSSINMDGVAQFWKGGVHKNCAVTILEVTDGKIELLEEGKVYY